ncbi:MFS general substrate transporter [Sparassis latifolia]|uniref:Uncharacterized MFS-type transporter n=1 Tax=Sparassis crispa TaxID=139825 RepID=A0A401GVU1_9APHY|nr:Uncharacterized MFS-type transporter [Sparassis crispa]GBE86348.1 Uncharacterized MFS-type transporter [Sparassis crispa]
MSRDEEATLADERTSELVIHGLEDVHEPIDPRISPSDRPASEVLDESYTHQFSDYMHHRDHHHAHDHHDESDLEAQRSSIEKHLAKVESHPESQTKPEEEPLYIEFDKGDKRDPVNFCDKRKWMITLSACWFSVLVASSSAAYALGFPSMMRDLNCTEFQATIGLSLYALGFGIVPLVSASFSEEFGRQPLYLWSGVGFVLMQIMTALAKNVQTVMIGRFLAGAFGSTGSTMVGGTVADIWMPHQRGFAMSMFTTAAIGAIGLGPVASGWIEQNRHLEWRWIQWIHVIFSGVFVLLNLTLMKETRASVLLVRLAKKMRKETGDHRYRARVEDERASLTTLIYISCTRPIYLLITEPVVLSFTLWIGFVWGILYTMIESIGPVFQKLHGFNSGETGTVFSCLILSCVLGVIGNVWQERLYLKYVEMRGPEARLFAPCVAAIVFPAGLFIYAWSTYSHVYWISLCVGIVLIMWALWVVYLAVFTYIADCYGPFASSALAGQSLFRNLMGMAFPLFTQQMFARLTYHWANTLFALIAVVLIPIPYVLFFKGPAIRARSKFAKQVMQELSKP